MVMVVMMVVSTAVADMAVPVVTMLRSGFQFQSGMPDAMLFQCLSHQILDSMGVCIGDDVHGGIMLLSIQTADVNVMDVFNAIDGA